MLKRIFFTALIAIPIFPMQSAASDLSVSLHQDAPEYWADDVWTVYSYPSEEMCEVSAKTFDSEEFTLAYFPRDKAFTFILTNSSATSVEGGEKVSLLVAFIKSGKADLGWGNRQFEVHKVDGRVAFSSPLLPAPIDKDFASSERMGIMTTSSTGSKKLVAGISLQGSATAIQHLKTCAFSAAGLNADDPFLQ